MEIERLFDNDRAVPGMRRSESVRIEADGGDAPADDVVRGTVHRERREPADPAADGPGADAFPIALLQPVKPGPELRYASDPGNPRSERMRVLRTEILLRHPVQQGVVAFAVVGATPGEGRTRLTAELALAFSQLGRPTLLVDADMRRPGQHLLFGTELREGLAQAIERSGEPLMVGVEGFPHLSLLTAGGTRANAIELLSDGRFENLVQDLARDFDFILFDTPPCADFADGVVISTLVGHVLTVHRARHTDYRAARAMLRQLESAHAHFLGSALNHF